MGKVKEEPATLATASDGCALLAKGSDHFHMKYHHGRGDTIMAKKLQVEIGSPKVIRIDAVAAQDSGSARAM